MSLVRKIILAGAVGLTALTGCDIKEPDAIDKKTRGQNPEITTDERYFSQDSELLAEFGELETITTQIADVQEGFVEYGNCMRPYKFIEANGGDADRLILIYPCSRHFHKYTPVEITFKRIKNRQMTSKEFIKRYIGTNILVSDADNYVITADGIIEPDGVKYIEDAEK